MFLTPNVHTILLLLYYYHKTKKSVSVHGASETSLISPLSYERQQIVDNFIAFLEVLHWADFAGLLGALLLNSKQYNYLRFVAAWSPFSAILL